MARGFSAVRTASKDISERKNSGGNFTSKRFLKIGDGEDAVVRFLEQGDEVVSAWFHNVDIGRKFPVLVPCIDQDAETGERVGKECPGCESNDKDEAKRRFKSVLNVIWRNAPVYEVDSEGKTDWKSVVGYEDTVVLWQPGIEVSEDLNMLDEDYNGLSSRDFKIRRRGSGLDTKYSVSPANPDGGASPMSDEDKALAENKYDLNEIVTPEPYDKWGIRGGSDKEVRVPISDTSPFMKKKN